VNGFKRGLRTRRPGPAPAALPRPAEAEGEGPGPAAGARFGAGGGPTQGVRRVRLPLAALVFFLAVAWVALGPYLAVQSGAPLVSLTTEPGHDGNGSAVAAPAAAAARPPDASAAVQRMRGHGLAKLGVSDCWEAEWYFSGALKLIEAQGNETHAANLERLQGERGFSLVCSQRFEEGAVQLEQQLHAGGGLRKGPPHLVNALGYARFRLEDYDGAVVAFEAGIVADPANPILWNNLAAANMVRGEIRAADDALFHAVVQAEPEASEVHFHMEEYHRLLFLSNVQNLASRAGGQAAELPGVELWWGGDEAPGS